MALYRIKTLLVIALMAVITLYSQSCEKQDLISIPNAVEMQPALSAYQIFRGNPSDLVPKTGFDTYELATPLYSDYSEKQRLIKLPAGTKLKATGDGLPEFPDGTMLVKTFFYFNDKRDVSAGKRIMETRVLIKLEGKWSMGTYVWNEEQTDADLLTSGQDKPVTWLDENGSSRTISYHIPKNAECNSCHEASNTLVPIGPKIRNLNRDVVRSDKVINQLEFFQGRGLLDPMNPSSFSKLPEWDNTNYSLEERTRAYLDVNCAHCHSETGFCPDARILLNYELSLDETRIKKRQKTILNRMEDGKMPMLGIRVVHKEGFELVKSYIRTLPKD